MKRYGGTRQIDKIAETKQNCRYLSLQMEILLDAQSAIQMVKDTGCDGIMVGRGAMKTLGLSWRSRVPFSKNRHR